MGYPKGRPRGRQSQEHRDRIRAGVLRAIEEDKPWTEVYNQMREATDGDPELASEMVHEYMAARNEAREGADYADYRALFTAQFGTSDQIGARALVLAAARREELICEPHGEFRCPECKEHIGYGVIQPSSDQADVYSDDEIGWLCEFLLGVLEDTRIRNFITGALNGLNGGQS